MTQELLDFGRLHRVEEHFKKAFRSVETAVDILTPTVAAGAAGIEQPDLCKTFAPNSNRHLRLKTVMAVGACMTAVEYRRAIITPIAAALGFDVQLHQPMDDREARIRLEEALRGLGPLGVEKLNEVYGGRR